jgi:hypothetical protein
MRSKNRPFPESGRVEEEDPRFEPEDESKERTVVFQEERTAIVLPQDVATYARRHAVKPLDEEGADDADEASDSPPPSEPRSAVTSTVRPSPAFRPEADADPLERVMFDHIGNKDYAAAMIIAETILQKDPAHKSALLCREKCSLLLVKKYADKIGGLKAVPVVKLGKDLKQGASLDPRTAFVLSLMDGMTDLDTVLDLCAMPRLEALRLIYELSLDGVVGFE